MHGKVFGLVSVLKGGTDAARHPVLTCSQLFWLCCSLSLEEEVSLT